jgi:hypothetical protein
MLRQQEWINHSFHVLYGGQNSTVILRYHFEGRLHYLGPVEQQKVLEVFSAEENTLGCVSSEVSLTMLVIFESLPFKQHICFKRIKDFKVLVEVWADHTLNLPVHLQGFPTFCFIALQTLCFLCQHLIIALSSSILSRKEKIHKSHCFSNEKWIEAIMN